MTSLTRPTTILIDLDHTLLEFSHTADENWMQACRAHAHRFGGLSAESVHAAIRKEADWYWADAERHRVGRQRLDASRCEIASSALAAIGIPPNGLAGDIAGTYSRLREAGIGLADQAVETLDTLRARGFRLAILTNGSPDPQRTKITNFALEPHVDAVFVEGEVGVGKPDPRAYRNAMSALGSTPDQTWMVGDNLEWEVIAPQQLGMTCVWVDNGRTGLPAGTTVRPERIIGTFSELVSGEPPDLDLTPYPYPEV